MRTVLIIIFALISLAFYSSQRDPELYQGGLCNSNGGRTLNSKQLQVVLESLRHKTGFLEMRFDQAERLTLGDRSLVAGGSPSARELLIAAVDGERLFKLESHNQSLQIAFAQIKDGGIYRNWQINAQIEVRLLQLDFADFTQLRGSDEALASFDVGFSILHELAHGVWRLSDTTVDQRQIGPCEELINRIRRELGLPERQSYYASVRPAQGSQSTALQAELLFTLARHESGRARVRKFYLQWDANRVAVRDDSALRHREHAAPAAAVSTQR